MTCKQCGTANPETNRFCSECGSDMLQTATAQQGSGFAAPYQTAAQPVSSYSSSSSPMGFAGSNQIVMPQAQLVGFGPRLGAYLIDAILLYIVQAILNIIHLGGLALIVGAAYFSYMWATSGQSLGMMALSIKVIRVNGEPLTYGTAFVRYLGYIVSSIPLGLGFLWIIWDPQKQGFHDKIAGTVVVRSK